MRRMYPHVHRLRSAVSGLPSLRHLARVPILLLATACAGDDPGPPPEVPGAPSAPVADTPSRQPVDPAEPAAPPTPAEPAPAPGTPAPPAAEAPPAGGGSWVRGVIAVRRTVTGAALLRDVRTASHEGFDRIVLDFGDTGVPGYHIEYIDRPVRQCGSGETVPLAGDAWLQVRVEPANAHTEEGRPTITSRERRPGLSNLLELKMTCDFEAQVEWVGGVRTPSRFRAFVLGSPDRLVVDVLTR